MTESNATSAPTPTRAAAATASRPHGHRHHATSHHGASFHRHVAHVTAKSAPAEVPQDVTAALKTAMDKEGVPGDWEAGLHFIIQKESAGKVGAANKVDTARGLFQLTKASYHLNPNGAASFGNAVEEAQGGIRYVAQRYQTADNAVGFWKKHGWY